MIRLTLLALSLLSVFAAADDFKPVSKKLPPGQTTDQDLPAIDGPSLNAGDRFEVGSFDPKSRTYKIVLRADPSAGPLFTTAENLANAVANLKLEKLLKEPYSIVRFDYSVENGKELKLLDLKDVDARRAKSPGKTAPKGPEKTSKD